MSGLYLLIIVAFTDAIGFLMAFIWAVRSGQFDDIHTPSMRILLDTERSSQLSKIKIKEEDNGD